MLLRDDDPEGATVVQREEKWFKRGVIIALLVLLALFVAGGVSMLAVNVYITSLRTPGGIITDDTTPVTNVTWSPLILISSDGFRWDYLGRVPTPNLDRLISKGVLARSLKPSFPSKTFPNHYTLVTGLYPAHHGIIDNTIYDPEWNAWFRLSDANAVRDGRWWGGEPFWVTCERQGIKAGTYFWPGSEAVIGGMRPSYWLPYNGNTPYTERVSTMLQWLDKPVADRPQFLTLYMEGVDHEGHYAGPESPRIGEAMQLVDEAVGQLLDGLAARNMLDTANIIFTADHGMTELSTDRIIRLSNYLDSMADMRVITYYPVLNIRPNPGKEELVFNRLRNAHPNLTMYWDTDVPERFHFSGNRRIGRIVGIADKGWVVVSGGNQGLSGLVGNHGFDNEEMDMHAVFIASGPSFVNQTEVVPTFDNVHVYSLMAAVLNVTPAQTDGSLDSVAHLLAVPPPAQGQAA